MSDVLQEFLDQNLHRAYPLQDSSGGIDTTGAFTIPSSLITDIYLCVPNLPFIDKSKFYVENILVRRFYIDVTIGYDDPAVTRPVGIFKNLATTAQPQTTYDLTPSEFQSGDQFAPLYHMSGQITFGDATEIIRSLGSWSFVPSDDAHATYLVSSRISKGLLNVQYISINGRLFTGNVRFREGNNVTMSVGQRTRPDGEEESVITVSASLNAGSVLQLTNDADVLDAMTALYGRPIRTINGMLPDQDRNFTVSGGDCTGVDPAGSHSVVISNPCASPCCDEDANISAILESIANLNLRYAQLRGFLDSAHTTLSAMQNKLLLLGSEV